MNLEDLNNLDLRDINFSAVGEWPLAGRVAVMAAIVIIVLVLGYFLVIRGDLQDLHFAQQAEASLKVKFEEKQHLASNLSAYEQQLKQMHEDFGSLLRQLPSKTEIDALLREVSQTAQEDGLAQQLFQPSAEKREGFYAEKPIAMAYTGSYQQLAKFVSDVSSLPRIVTIRDFKLHPVIKGDGSQLDFSVTAYTYRYLSAEEAATHKGKKKRRTRQ
ncbi:MAG: type 4a pilus biogenesis protein PilO [Gammaproteobacteria bacterium]